MPAADGRGERPAQARALRQHRTRQAAAVIRLEALPAWLRESCQVRFGTGAETLDEYPGP